MITEENLNREPVYMQENIVETQTKIIPEKKSFAEMVEIGLRNSKVAFLGIALFVQFIFLNAVAQKLSFSFAIVDGTAGATDGQSWLSYMFAYGIEIAAFLIAIVQAFKKQDEIKVKHRFEGFLLWIGLFAFIFVSAWGMLVSGMYQYKIGNDSDAMIKITDIFLSNPLKDTLKIDPFRFFTIFLLDVGMSFVVLILSHIIAYLTFGVVGEKKLLDDKVKAEARKEQARKRRQIEESEAERKRRLKAEKDALALEEKRQRVKGARQSRIIEEVEETQKEIEEIKETPVVTPRRRRQPQQKIDTVAEPLIEQPEEVESLDESEAGKIFDPFKHTSNIKAR